MIIKALRVYKNPVTLLFMPIYKNLSEKGNTLNVSFTNNSIAKMNNEPFKKFMEICQENYPLITFLFGKFIDFDEKFCFNIQGGLTYSK